MCAGKACGFDDPEGTGPAAPSALLTATARLLHFARHEDLGGVDVLFIAAFETAMFALSDSLADRMMLCACLGALDSSSKKCDTIMESVKLKGLPDAIFTTLEQAVMQVQPSFISIMVRKDVLSDLSALCLMLDEAMHVLL